MAKRLRLSLSFGAYESQDEISNGSANVLTVLDEEGEIDHRFLDPRDDVDKLDACPEPPAEKIGGKGAAAGSR